MKNILATIDFYGSERLIIDKAFEMAKAFDAKIWLLHVVAPEPEFVGFGVGPQYVRDARATELKKERRMLNQFADELELKGVKAQGLLLRGSTIEMIMKEAEKLKIDLIVTGHHDHNFVYKAFYGSVASGVINKTKIPVLLVPLE
jgi:nucleotide-binding universal stress UspA family protein